MTSLIPYAGQPRAPKRAGTPRPIIVSGRPRRKVLDEQGECKALMLFRTGNDTAEIADVLHCTLAAAANGVAHARDRERGR